MTEERDWDTEARAMNWVPEQEWKGDPPKRGFKTAQQWVEDGENILPIVKSQLDHVKEELSEVKSANKQFSEWFQDYKKGKEKETARLTEELEAAKAQAITDGDGEAFFKAEQELKEISVPENKLTPEQQSWLSANSWYNINPDMTAYANGLADQLVEQGYVDQSKAFFTELNAQVRKQFSGAFENPNRQRASGVESGGTKEVIDSKAKTYDNLPPDGKAACDSFVKQGFMTQEDYVASYEWE